MYTYGETNALIVCGDYAGDLEAIARVLNNFRFDLDKDQRELFVVVNGRIETDRYCIVGRSATPFGRYVAVEEEGEEFYYQPPLNEISGAIAPLLTSGTLEFVSVRSTYGQFVELEKLSIRSDGWAQTQSQRYDSGKRGKCSTENFELEARPNSLG